MSAQDKEEIVKLHNDYRTKVADYPNHGTATDLQKMVKILVMFYSSFMSLPMWLAVSLENQRKNSITYLFSVQSQTVNH